MYGRDGTFEPRYADHHAYPFWEWLVPLLLFALLLALAVWAVWRLTSSATPAAPALGGPAPFDPAVAELRMRYARGEVSPDEFSTIAAGLGAAPAPPPEWPVPADAPTVEEEPPRPPAA